MCNRQEEDKTEKENKTTTTRWNNREGRNLWFTQEAGHPIVWPWTAEIRMYRDTQVNT